MGSKIGNQVLGCTIASLTPPLCDWVGVWQECTLHSRRWMLLPNKDLTRRHQNRFFLNTKRHSGTGQLRRPKPKTTLRGSTCTGSRRNLEGWNLYGSGYRNGSCVITLEEKKVQWPEMNSVIYSYQMLAMIDALAGIR